MIASWVALIVLGLINGLALVGALTITAHALGWVWLVFVLVVVVDLFYANRTRFL